MPDPCPVCGAPSDDWPLDLCQEHWEDYTSATFYQTNMGQLPLPEGFDEEWIAKKRKEWIHV